MTRSNSIVLVSAIIGAVTCAAVAPAVVQFQPDAAASALAEAYRDAVASKQLQSNALLFYLRLAGCIWILVEWVAAYYLWRGYRLLKRRWRDLGFPHA